MITSWFRKYKQSFLVSFVVWSILNISELQKIFFDEGNPLIVFACKLLHLFFVFLIVYCVKNIYDNKHVEWVRHGLIIACIYFTVAFIVFLTIWPGTWSWDDIGVVTSTQWYQLAPWQHFLSSLFHIICLQTLPFFAGVVLIQIFLAAIIVGYCVAKVVYVLGYKEKKRIFAEGLLLLVTMFPPVMEYIYSGFRMGMYSYLELLLIVELFIAYREKQRLSFKAIVKICLLTIVVASWRTEGLYYLPFILLFLIVLGKKVIYRKYVFISIILCIILTMGIGKINNKLLNNSNYSLSATIMPVGELVKASDPNYDEVELEGLSRVINLDVIYENPDWGGEAYFWNGLIKDVYSQNDYSLYMKSYAKLMLKYPKVAFNCMYDLFKKTAGMEVEDGYSLQRTATTNTSGGAFKFWDASQSQGQKWTESKSIWKMPINNELRDTMLRFISCIDKDGKVTLLFHFFWNLSIPLILLFICLIYKIIKKDWYMVLIILAVLARVPLVFATASAPYFMYYLSTYLTAYFIGFVIILETIQRVDRYINKKVRTDKS